jgi:hypothetical protein
MYRRNLSNVVAARDREPFAPIFEGIQNDSDFQRLVDACERFARVLDAGRDTLKQPTRNLVQLHDQAAALRFLMDCKLAEWSFAFTGLGEPEYASTASGINTVKLFACLGGDTSRLYDYCAGGIVFEDLGRLLLCLKLVQGDASIRVLRLENSFRASQQEHELIGYR